MNNTLRTMIKNILEKGYRRLPICEVTLGKAFSVQFNKFVDGTDLGYNPMSRFVNGLGYELYVVPVKSSDEETIQAINKAYSSFISSSKSDIIDYLDSRQKGKPGRKPTGIAEEFNDVLSNLIDDIE